MNLEIFKAKETDSTNNWAKRSNKEEGVFRAFTQTNGKGRLQRKWLSYCDKNLYFSIKLKVNSPQEALHYNFISSLAIAETLNKDYNLKVTVKWPNDLLVNNKKFSGILSEFIQNKDKGHAIIGIGINCFFDTENTNIADKATSLHYHIKNFDKEVFFENVLISFKDFSDFYRKNGFEKILKAWNRYAQMENRNIITTINGKKQKVKVINLNNDASLKVVNKDGKLLTLFAGDIEYA